MNREERFRAITEEMKALYERKNADYGNSFHDAWQKFGSVVGLVYMDAKLNRVKQLLKNQGEQKVLDEKIDDTLIDLANYAIMSRVEEDCYTYNYLIENLVFLDGELAGERKDTDYLLQEIGAELIGLTRNFSYIAWYAINIKLNLEEQKEQQLATLPTSFKCLPVQIVLEEGGIMPQKSTGGAAAYDLFAPEDVLIYPGRNLVPLNFRLSMPYGVGATVNPRSGFSLNGFVGYDDEERKRFDADVQWGLIDCDYRGVCGVIIHCFGEDPFVLKRGTKFAQLCFQRYEDVEFQEVEQLEESSRTGGFGSTGTK